MAFASISEANLRKYMVTPAGKPPPGLKALDPHAPDPLLATYKAISALGVILTTSFVAVRIYTRWRVIKNLWWCWMALFIGEVAVGFKVIFSGAGKDQWNVSYYDFVLMNYWTVVAKAVYICCLVVLKVSILLQILRIFVPQRKGNQVIFWTATSLIVLNILFYVIEFFLAIIQCSPRERGWNKKIPGKCIGNSNIIWTAGFNVLNDILILIIPIARIWRLQMPTRRKIGVSLIFSTGFLALVTSVLRLYYSYRVIHTSNPSYYYLILGICFIAESAAGIIVGCMPSFPKFGSKLKSSWAGSRLLSLTSRHRLDKTSDKASEQSSHRGAIKEGFRIHESPHDLDEFRSIP